MASSANSNGSTIPHSLSDTVLQAHGFPPTDNYCCLTAKVRSTHADEHGHYKIDIDASAQPGMSGGLATLHANPAVAVGLVYLGGDDAIHSSLIGTARIVQFLKTAGLTLPIYQAVSAVEEAAYLSKLAEAHGSIDIRALKIATGAAHNPPIAELYIPLHTANLAEDEAKPKRAALLQF